ncbi:MAG TPA: hypothetical protein VIL33_00070 [Rhodothermia bacterium]
MTCTEPSLENNTGHTAAQVFAKMARAFEAAASEYPDLLRQYPCTFAGRPAMIRTVGRRCARHLVPPLSHLIDERAGFPELDLMIDVWDAEETGIPYPGPPVPSELLWTEFGHIVGEPDQQFLACLRPNLYSWIDRSGHRIIGCSPNGDRFTLYERAKPFLFPLLLWHGDRNAQVIHAALVEKGGRGVLIVGREGAGKTTTALACVQAGFNYLADDYVALKEEGRFFHGYSIYNSTWLDETHVTHFPPLRAHMFAGHEAKRPVLLSEVWPDRLSRVATIRMVVIPLVGNGSACTVRPASRREALFAVAPTSIAKRPGTSQRDLDRLGRLVESAPLHVLELGDDVRDAGLVVGGLLAAECAR